MTGKSDTYPDMNSREDQAIQEHSSRLEELQQLWNTALPEVAEALGVRVDNDPEQMLLKLEEQTAKQWMEVRSANPGKPIVLGIAGPGASGKGTLGGFLESKIGFESVTNTTTRDPRHYEVNGVDYFFASEAEFKEQTDKGVFLQWNEKPGRGLYGVRRDEVERKLTASGGVGCIIEESPANLVRTLGSESITALETQPLLVVLYVLPPHPIMETSARRLYGRSASIDEERILTSEDVNSTLGERQSQEFRDLTALKANPNVHLVVLINDELEEAQAKAQTLFG